MCLFSVGRDKGGVLVGLLVELDVTSEVSAEVDLDDDEGALFFVKRVRVRRGSVRDPSRVNEVRCCAMSGFKHHLGLCMGEDPLRYAAWRRGAFIVSGGGGDTLVVISRV